MFQKVSSPSNKNLVEDLKEEFSDEIYKALNDWAENNSNNLNVKDHKVFWAQYRKTFGKKTKNGVDILRNEDKELISDPKLKCDLFYRTFFTGQHLEGCDFDRVFKQTVEIELREVESALTLEPLEEADENGTDFTLTELRQALSKIQVSEKAFDGDEIHPGMIKHCGPVFQGYLLQLFNTCLSNNCWPWRQSKVIFLKKDGKTDYLDPSSYRPITLASYCGKLLERLIEQRLRRWMIKEDLIDEEQEGFCEGKSTTRYLYRLCAMIRNSKLKNKVGILLLADFEKAYGSVWVDGILYKLLKANLSKKLWKLIATFLRGRRINISVDGYSSKELWCLLGLPQGSILAPLLFIFYTADMLKNCKSKTFKYADDCSLYTDKNINNKEDELELIQTAQQDLNHIRDW